MDLTGMLRAMKESRSTWVLLIGGLIAGVLAAKFGPSPRFKESWFALGNITITAGYLTIFLTVAPYFKLGAEAKLGAMLFFLVCAGTHFELAVHAFTQEAPDWFFSTHMMAIHTAQPLVLWAFVLGLQKAQVVPRDTNG